MSSLIYAMESKAEKIFCSFKFMADKKTMALFCYSSMTILFLVATLYMRGHVFFLLEPAARGKGEYLHQDVVQAGQKGQAYQRSSCGGHKGLAVKQITEEVKQLYSLGGVGRETSQDDWTVSLIIGNIPVTFKIDTGPDDTVINQGTFKIMRLKIKCGPSDTCFISPGGNLRCTDLFQATSNYKKKQDSLPGYVIREKGNCRPEAVEMGLVKWVDEVSEVFSLSRLLKTHSVRIPLQEDTQPYATQTARPIPLPLASLVKNCSAWKMKA